MANAMTKDGPRTLLPGELELQRWGGLVLTTHRLMHHNPGSTASLTSLLLRDLNWTRIGRTHTPLLLAFAAINALGSAYLFATHGDFAPFFLLLGLLTAFLYIVGRRATMTFAAGEGRIEIRLKGTDAGWASAGTFADAVEHAALRTAPLT